MSQPATQPITRTIPEKPGLEGIEAKWSTRWETQRIYAFDRTAARDAVHSIDTPPPTVFGSLHVGHVFSYTHADLIARRPNSKIARSTAHGTTSASWMRRGRVA